MVFQHVHLAGHLSLYHLRWWLSSTERCQVRIRSDMEASSSSDGDACRFEDSPLESASSESGGDEAWTYEVLATEALRRRQMEAVERVCNVLSVEEDVAYALLKHCKWCEARTRSATCVAATWKRR
eukprot:jgi/Pico_ML_1/53175/g3774.t2